MQGSRSTRTPAGYAACSRSPRVTVCVPTIGRAEYLRQTLESLAKQTYQDYEVLVLDNASPDDAQEVIRSFAKEDARTRILRTNQRVPMFVNFNRGIHAAVGEYVVFFHDDDVYLPAFIERQVEVLAKNPTVGFVGSNCYLIDEFGRAIGRRELIKRTEVWTGRRFIRTLIKRGRNVMSTQGITYRRSVLRSFGFNEAIPVLAGDFVVLMRMAETCDIGLIAELAWKNRIHGEAGSFIALSKAIPLRTELMRKYAAEYAVRWPNDKAFGQSLEKQLARSHLVWLLWGWISAKDESEAEACLKELIKLRCSIRLETVLRLMDRLVLSFGRRRAILTSLLRWIGNGVGA